MMRLHVVTGFIIVLAGAVVARLFFLQVTRADEFQLKADRQHTRVISGQTGRGSIFFTDKYGVLAPAAITHRTFLLEGNPQRIENPLAVYEQIQKIIALEKDAFLEAAERNVSYVVFVKGITRYEAEQLSDLAIPGVWISDEESRVYPEGSAASHVLGFVGFSDDNRIGRYGLEKQYEDVLRHSDIALTIDPNIQTLAHSIARDLIEEWNADSAGILVMDPHTGAIVAMESAPGFDPNAYGEVHDYTLFLNPFTQSVFEMGSIVKPLTMAAGLDAYAITEDTTYYDTGVLRIQDATISNYDGVGRGRQTMYDILDQSLNTGSVFIMRQLGKNQFKDYMERYGLGAVTGIDLPQEIAGNLRNMETGGDVEYATASFGQGVAVTPIGLAAALSAVANGGELVRPYVVRQIMDFNTAVSTTQPFVRRRVLREETSETISRMLSRVVDNTLAGGLAHMPGYHIAAKTGTAQIANKDSPGYSDYYLHTFFGYAPAFDPQFFILLYLEEPKGVRYASQTLAKPFRQLAEFIINYYEIPPDR